MYLEEIIPTICIATKCELAYDYGYSNMRHGYSAVKLKVSPYLSDVITSCFPYTVLIQCNFNF